MSHGLASPRAWGICFQTLSKGSGHLEGEMWIQRRPVVWEFGWFCLGPCPQLFSCLRPIPPTPPPQPPMAGTVHRAQGSPSRAHPQNPAAGSGAGGLAGAGGAGRGAGRPPGEHGGHSGSDAAAIWAASPRPRGRSRNGGTSGGRTRVSEGILDKWHLLLLERGGWWPVGLQEPLRSRECFACSQCEFSFTE